MNTICKEKGARLQRKSLASVLPAGISSGFNRAVDVLPEELHLPRCRFYGPGTYLEERLARGKRGINQLNEACREHDTAYAQYKDNKNRGKAERILAAKTSKRMNARNSGVSESANATAAVVDMKVISSVGGRLCYRRRRRRRQPNRKNTRKTIISCGNSLKRRVNRRKVGRGLYLNPYRKN